jgi:hypothetical protein
MANDRDIRKAPMQTTTLGPLAVGRLCLGAMLMGGATPPARPTGCLANSKRCSYARTLSSTSLRE